MGEQTHEMPRLQSQNGTRKTAIMPEPGDVIQVRPNSDAIPFRGCLATVDSVRTSHVDAYVAIPDQPPRLAFIRLNHEEYHVVGKAHFIVSTEERDG